MNLRTTIRAFFVFMAFSLPAQAEDITVTYAINERIDIIGDPARIVIFGEQYVSRALFEPLITDFNGRTGESGLFPALATSWTPVEDLRWRFTLREGVTFHNGEPFNAEAVRYSIERHLAPDFPSSDKFRDVPIAAVEVVDNYTVDIVTRVPTPVLPQQLSRNGAYIVAPGHYSAISLDEALIQPVGTGPFRLVEFRRDDRVILERNPDYWGFDENSNIDRLVFRIITEASTAFSELLSGTVDILRISADLADVVESRADLRLVIAPTRTRAIMIFNTQVHPALEDSRVRRALNLAIDKDALIDAFAFGQRDLRSLTLINPPNEHVGLEPFPFDPEAARALLAEAGYPDGFAFDTIDVMIPDAYDFAEAVSQFWAQVGVRVGEVRRLESSVMRERLAARTLSVSAMQWSAAENTPETDAHAVHDGRQNNSTNWVNPVFMETYAALTATVDPAERRALSDRLQEVLMEDPPWAYLYRVPAIFAVNQRIEGYNPHPSLLLEDWAAIYVAE